MDKTTHPPTSFPVPDFKTLARESGVPEGLLRAASDEVRRTIETTVMRSALETIEAMAQVDPTDAAAMHTALRGIRNVAENALRGAS